MKTQITKIAMFAIAAFALVGMMGGSVFANNTGTEINSTVTANSGIASSSYTYTGCGIGTTCEGKVKSSTTGNWVKAYYGVDNGTCATTHVQAWVNGSPVIDTHRYDHSGTGNFIKGYLTVDSGDTITSKMTYTSCI